MDIRRSSPILIAAIAVFAALPPLAEAGIDRLVLLPDATVAGGVPVKAEVRLDEAANRDTRIRLRSGTPSLASVPDSVTVPRGRSSALFRVTTAGTTQPASVTLHASDGKTLASTTLLVTRTRLVGLSFRPEVIEVNRRATATLSLEGTAPAGGATVAIAQQPGAQCRFQGLLSTMQPSIDYPAQITIPAGERNGSFEVTAQSLPVGAVTCRVVFEATWSGDTVPAELSISGGLQSGT